VLDVELDLVSELRVVRVTFLDLEVDQKTEMRVEAEQLILLVLVVFEDALELGGVTLSTNVSATTVKAVAVLRKE